METSFKFFIVRHPFERLTSVFEDKFATQHRRSLATKQFSEIHHHIIEKYRTNKENKSLYPTFLEFVEYLLNEAPRNRTIEAWNKYPAWSPYYTKCRPCSVSYDAIFDLKSLEKEQKYLFHRVPELSFLSNLKNWEHKSPRSNNDRNQAYFSQLTMEQIYKLYKLYDVDFKMFSYNYIDFLKYAKDAP